MGIGKNIQTFDIADVQGGCNYADDLTALTKNQSPDSMNVEFFNGRMRKRYGYWRVNSTVGSGGQGGIDSYTVLMLHGDGSNDGTTYTDEKSHTVTAAVPTASSVAALMYGDGSDDGTTFTEERGLTVSLGGNEVTKTGTKKFGTASMYYPGGTNDYSQILGCKASGRFNFGNNPLTIDFWVNFETVSSGRAEALLYQLDDANNYWLIHKHTDNTLEFYFRVAGAYPCTLAMASAWAPVAGTWYHLAFCANTDTGYIYINGVSQTLDSSTITSPRDLGERDDNIFIGFNDAERLHGYIDEIRITNGLCRWTENFTPPVRRQARTVTKTAQKVFGTASLYLSGCGLSTADSADWDFGAGAFTFDMRVKTDSLTGTQILLEQLESVTRYWNFSIVEGRLRYKYVYGTTTVEYICNTDSITAVDTWYHIAFVRTGDTVYFFVNGEAQTYTIVSAFATTTLTGMAASLEIGKTDTFYGYIDELRISKGVARWTANFTPPTLPYDTYSTVEAPPYVFSVVNFPSSTLGQKQVAHIKDTVYAFNEVTDFTTTLRSNAPYTPSYNAKVRSYLIQTYEDYSAPYYWGGGTTGMLQITNAPSFKRAIEFQGYLMGMNTEANPMRIYYQSTSDILGAITAYTDYFTLTPAPNDDQITDPFLLNGRLYVGSRYSIFRVSFVGGVTVFEYKQIIVDVGIVPNTVQLVVTKEFGQVALFLGYDRRVYMFDGSNIKAVSDLFQIANQWAPIALDLVSDFYLTNSFAVYDTRFRIYRLFVTKRGESKNRYCLNIDVDTFAFYPFDGMAFASGCMAYDGALKPYLICGDYLGRLHKMFIPCNTDDGASIVEYYTSPMVSVKDPYIKQGQDIMIHMLPTSSNNLLVYDKVDFRSTWQLRQKLPCSSTRDKHLGENFILGSSLLGVEKDVIHPRIGINVTFNHYQFKITSESYTKPRWEIYSIDVDQSVLVFGESEVQR